MPASCFVRHHGLHTFLSKGGPYTIASAFLTVDHPTSLSSPLTPRVTVRYTPSFAFRLITCPLAFLVAVNKVSLQTAEFGKLYPSALNRQKTVRDLRSQ